MISIGFGKNMLRGHENGTDSISRPPSEWAYGGLCEEYVHVESLDDGTVSVITRRRKL